MNKIQQIVPISDMAIKQQDVMKRLGNGPVVLASRSRPVAVLLSVSEWDAIAVEMEALRDIVDVQEADLLQGDNETEAVDLNELRRMAGHAVHA